MLLRKLMENYGRTWTAKVITTVGNGSITIRHMDGSLGTIAINAGTAVLFHDQPALTPDLRQGERVRVNWGRNDPSTAEKITIQGTVSDQ